MWIAALPPGADHAACVADLTRAQADQFRAALNAWIVRGHRGVAAADYYWRALLADRSRDRQAAVADMEHALALTPDSIDALHCLAQLQHAGDARDAARRRFNQVLELDPDHIDARIGRARLLSQVQDWEAAKRDLDHAVMLIDTAGTVIRADQGVRALFARGVCLATSGNLRAAIDDLRRALAQAPDDQAVVMELQQREGELARQT